MKVFKGRPNLLFLSVCAVFILFCTLTYLYLKIVAITLGFVAVIAVFSLVYYGCKLYSEEQ